jgi:hypothetical protein
MITAAKLASAWRLLGPAARRRQCWRVLLVPRFLALYGPGRFTPGEISRLGLLEVPASRLPDYISKYRLVRIQDRLNPREVADRAEDKALFYRVCAQAGLPIPSVLAEIDLDEPVSSLDRLADLPAGEIVVKPSLGYYGLGLMLLTHREGRFLASDGTALTAGDLLARLASDVAPNEGFRRWVVQARVANHSAVTAISPSPALQTLRVVSFVDDQGEPHILASQWRLAGPQAATDNFRGGLSGNLLCNIDVETGRVRTALRLAPEGDRMEALPHHPVSGVPLENLALPLWAEARALALRACLAMLPLRSIGWDIGLTPEGPILIEANNHWDPQNADGGMGARLRFMAARTRLFRYR